MTLRIKPPTALQLQVAAQSTRSPSILKRLDSLSEMGPPPSGEEVREPMLGLIPRNVTAPAGSGAKALWKKYFTQLGVWDVAEKLSPDQQRELFIAGTSLESQLAAGDATPQQAAGMADAVAEKMIAGGTPRSVVRPLIKGIQDKVAPILALPEYGGPNEVLVPPADKAAPRGMRAPSSAAASSKSSVSLGLIKKRGEELRWDREMMAFKMGAPGDKLIGRVATELRYRHPLLQNEDIINALNEVKQATPSKSLTELFMAYGAKEGKGAGGLVTVLGKTRKKAAPATSSASWEAANKIEPLALQNMKTRRAIEMASIVGPDNAKLAATTPEAPGATTMAAKTPKLPPALMAKLSKLPKGEMDQALQIINKAMEQASKSGGRISLKDLKALFPEGAAAVSTAIPSQLAATATRAAKGIKLPTSGVVGPGAYELGLDAGGVITGAGAIGLGAGSPISATSIPLPGTPSNYSSAGTSGLPPGAAAGVANLGAEAGAVGLGGAGPKGFGRLSPTAGEELVNAVMRSEEETPKLGGATPLPPGGTTPPPEELKGLAKLMNKITGGKPVPWGKIGSVAMVALTAWQLYKEIKGLDDAKKSGEMQKLMLRAQMGPPVNPELLAYQALTQDRAGVAQEDAARLSTLMAEQPWAGGGVTRNEMLIGGR